MTHFVRLDANLDAVLALVDSQDTRIALRGTTRLSLYPSATVPAWMGAYVPNARGVEIAVDGRRVGMAFGATGQRWLFTITNQDGAALNEAMALAIDQALQAAAAGTVLNAATADVFDRWTALAKETSDALSKELFGV